MRFLVERDANLNAKESLDARRWMSRWAGRPQVAAAGKHRNQARFGRKPPLHYELMETTP